MNLVRFCQKHWSPQPCKDCRIEELETAITKCLNNNGHLADGDCCTLIDLKRAVPNWELEGDNGLQVSRGFRPAAPDCYMSAVGSTFFLKIIA